jgi:hypothetical protein
VTKENKEFSQPSCANYIHEIIFGKIIQHTKNIRKVNLRVLELLAVIAILLADAKCHDVV